MNLQERIQSFVKLGDFLSQFQDKELQTNCSELNNTFYEKFNDLISEIKIHNPWFAENNVRYSISAIAKNLEPEKLKKWLKNYPELSKPNKKKKVGVVMAGNVPLVGFYDFLSVLISGNIIICKLSSKDYHLLEAIADILIAINPEFKELIFFEKEYLAKTTSIDAIIATGSNNTSRYFEYYFEKYPNIIRKNRSSVAILDSNETKEDLQKLADDIFLYFGLGCRNVAKLFVPQDYNFNLFFEAIEHYNFIKDNNKYANNYEYNKSIYLMNKIAYLDNGFVLLKKDSGFFSPISTIFFEYYTNFYKLAELINTNKKNIQCIVTNDKSQFILKKVNFGDAQRPELWDYADNVDTLEFLINL